MGEELGKLVRLASLDLGVEALDDHLAEPLAGAHHVGGVHGLVRGDEHEALAAVDHGGVGGLIGAQGVVLDGLAGAVLHQRHMLVGGCMVDNVGPVIVKDLIHSPAVAHRTDQNDKI